MRLPRWIYKIPLRLRSIVRRGRVEADLDEEFRFHFDSLVEQNVAGGMTPEDARHAALRALDGIEVRKEECRDARGLVLVDHVLQDLRYTLRAIRRAPGFSALVVLVLALGIGANTAIFSVVNAALLRRPPFPDSGQLFRVWDSYGTAGNRGPVSWPNFVDWRKWNRSFSGMAAFTPREFTVTGAGPARRIRAVMGSASLFEVLDVQPAIGRRFLPQEDLSASLAGTNPTIISHAFWQAQFGSDPSSIGRVLTLDGKPFTVVGVMPAGFDDWTGIAPVDCWVTAALLAETRPGSARPMSEERQISFLEVVARLRPGTGQASAQADMDRVAAMLLEAHRDENEKAGVTIAGLQSTMTGSIRMRLLFVLGAASLVLIIACADVSALLLARVTRRQREITIRAALGAPRSRVVRQMLTEGCTLAAGGGLAGVWLAWVSGKGLARWLDVAGGFEPQLDGAVLGFALVLCVVATVAMSIAPAIHAARFDLLSGLKESVNVTQTARQRRLQSVLIACQLALATVLLSSAGLLTMSLIRLQQVHLGFDPTRVLTFPVNLDAERYPNHRYAVFYDDLLTRLAALPGVEAAAAGGHVPLRGGMSRTTIDRVDNTEIPLARRTGIVYEPVTAGYFRTLGIEVEQGRDFTSLDRRESTPVVILNRAAATRYFGRVNPIGRRIEPVMWNGSGSQTQPRTVVGVVADVRHRGPSVQPAPTIYWPVGQVPCSSVMYIAIRTTVDPLTLTAGVRTRLQEIDAMLPLDDVEPLSATLAENLAHPRLNSVAVGGFAAVALLLTTIGIWGLIAYSASQRTHEIGVRMALGASRRAIVRGFARQGLLLGVLGVLAGSILALATARLMRGLLFDIATESRIIVAGSGAILLTVALVASCIPARRATRIDPLVALRTE